MSHLLQTQDQITLLLIFFPPNIFKKKVKSILSSQVRQKQLADYIRLSGHNLLTSGFMHLFYGCCQILH
jgi:hypothetical protein